MPSKNDTELWKQETIILFWRINLLFIMHQVLSDTVEGIASKLTFETKVSST